MTIVLTRPDRIAGAVRKSATTDQSICPTAKARTISARKSTTAAAPTMRP